MRTRHIFSVSCVTRCALTWRARRTRQVGLTVTATSEQVGAFALAYAVHKAASPIRFPPTVALTPVRPAAPHTPRVPLTRRPQLVAKWMGKEIKA